MKAGVPRLIDALLGLPNQSKLFLLQRKKRSTGYITLAGLMRHLVGPFSFVHRIGPNRGLHLDGIPFTTVLSRMLTPAHYSQQQNQGNDGLQSCQLGGSQGFSYIEANDNIHLPELTETQTPLSSLHSPFTVLDSDIDISKNILHAPDEILHEILLL